MKKNKKWFHNFNRERLLLTTLVAISFFGFLLWSIEQVSQEEASLLSVFSPPSNPAKNESIKIVSPKINQIIKSPVKISGQTTVTESFLQIRIKDASGLVLAQKESYLKTGQKMSNFSYDLVFKKPTRPKGTLEVFTHSSKDTVENNKLTIPIIFGN